MNDAANRTLEVEVLNIHKGEYLSEALKRQGYPMLPSNAIINKVMTGGKSHQIDPQCLTHTDPSCFYPFNIPLSMRLFFYPSSSLWFIRHK